MIAKCLRSRSGPSSGIWHLLVKIGGRQMYQWRAVDSEGGEVLDMLV